MQESMELKQLDALAAVAEHGRFSAAARALDTVQSNISTHIARLEDDLGAILVDRSAGELTPEGQAVLTRARRINTELAALRDDVTSMTSRVSGQVRIGIIGTGATAIQAIPHLGEHSKHLYVFQRTPTCAHTPFFHYLGSMHMLRATRSTFRAERRPRRDAK